MRPPRVERVPAHVRDLQRRVRRRDPVDLAGIQPSPSVTSYSRPRSAMSCMPTQMPRNGRPRARTLSLSASTMPPTASSPRRQSAKAPTPGSTTRSARRDLLGIAGHDDRLVQAGLARGALERLGRRMQIARAVIDDGDAHRAPPACGNRPRTSDRALRLRGIPLHTTHAIAAAGRGCMGADDSSAALLDPGVEEPPLGGFEIVSDDDADVRPAAGAPGVKRRSVAASKPTSNASSSADRDDHRRTRRR